MYIAFQFSILSFVGSSLNHYFGGGYLNSVLTCKVYCIAFKYFTFVHLPQDSISVHVKLDLECNVVQRSDDLPRK